MTIRGALAEGDTRAVLLNLEDRLACALFPEERGELQRQIDALVASQQDTWLGGWRRPAGVVLEWRGGFVRAVRFRRADGLAAALQSLQALAELEVGQQMERLGLDFLSIGDEGAALLASSRALRAFQQLTLALTKTGPEGASALAHSEQTGELTTLDLSYNPIGDEGARALARSPALRSLQRLILTGTSISEAVKNELATSLPGCRLEDGAPTDPDVGSGRVQQKDR